jgi:hypothetical protein
MMPVVHIANAPDAGQQGGIPGVTAQGVSRIGGKGDQPPVTHDLRGLLDKPGLGLVGMQGKKLSHDSK